MAVAENSNPNQRDWKKRESFTSAMIQVLIVAAVLSVAVYFFYQRSARAKQVAELLKDAKALAVKDNPKDLAKASKELEEIFKIDDSAKDALALAADIETERWIVHRVQGADAKAREYLKKAEASESKSEDLYGNKIIHLVADGKPGDAETYAEELRKKGANSAKILYGIGQAHLHLGNLALSRAAFTQATEKAWKNPRYFAGYGEALLDQADYRLATEVLTKGLNANPEHLRLKADLALARIYREDRVKDASDAINEVLAEGDAVTPGLQARALAAKAELANFENRFDDAVKTADEALALNPTERFALFARARALAKKKDPGAVDAFQKAIAVNRTAPVPYFAGAQLLQEAGNHDGAMALLADYEKVYSAIQVTDSEGKAQPAIQRDDKYWIVRGDILRAAGKQDLAMESYEKAIAADGVNRTKAHYAKGALLLEKKDYENALVSILKVTPEDGTGQIAEAYAAKGQIFFAKKEFPIGCQNFAFALTRMRAQQAPREKMNALLDDVTKQLVANGQKEMSKAWEKEAKPLIQ